MISADLFISAPDAQKYLLNLAKSINIAYEKVEQHFFSTWANDSIAAGAIASRKHYYNLKAPAATIAADTPWLLSASDLYYGKLVISHSGLLSAAPTAGYNAHIAAIVPYNAGTFVEEANQYLWRRHSTRDPWTDRIHVVTELHGIFSIVQIALATTDVTGSLGMEWHIQFDGFRITF
jgi:hypothetical protein